MSKNIPAKRLRAAVLFIEIRIAHDEQEYALDKTNQRGDERPAK